MVVAEAVTVATALTEAVHWPDLGAGAVVGGPDHWWDVPGVPGIALRGRVEVRTVAPGGERGPDRPALWCLMSGLPGASSGDELLLPALVDVLRHPDGPVPATLAKPVPDTLRTAVATCVACHGANFSTPTDGTIPRLAGQYPDYLRVALKSYKVEGNPHYGRANPVMGAMAKPLTDETIDEIATYLSSLPGELRTVPQPKFK